MQVYGFLEKAQLENVSADLSNTLAGLIWFNTTDSRARFYDGGAIRSVVDENSTQTITGKTLTGNIIASFSPDGVQTITAPIISGALLVDQHTLNYMDFLHQTTPAAPSVGGIRVYSKNDNQLYKLDSEGNEVPIGTGGGGLDIFFIEDFSVNNAADMDSGNNASFLGGGTIQGALSDFVDSEGNRQLRYTQAAGSLNDYFAGPVFSVPVKARNNKSSGKFVYTYSGNAGDMKPEIYDVTNAASLVSDLVLLESGSTYQKFEIFVDIPESCTQLRWGFQTKVENAGAILTVDDIQFNSDALIAGNFLEIENLVARGNSGQALTPNVSNIPFNFVSGDMVGWDGSTFTARKPGTYNFSGSVAHVAGSSAYIYAYINGVSQGTFGTSPSSQEKHFSGSLKLEIGDVLSFRVDQAVTLSNNDPTHHLSIDSIVKTRGVSVRGFDTNDIANQNEFPIQISSIGTLVYDPFGIVSSVVRNSSGNYTINFNPGVFSSDPMVTLTPINSGRNFDARTVSPSSFNALFQDPTGATNLDVDFTAKISRGNDTVKDSERTVVLPSGLQNPVAYIKDVKGSNTQGGTFNSGAWQERDLNTLEQVGGNFVTLASNRFTLPPGEYEIHSKAPARGVVNKHTSRLLSTDSTIKIVGTSSRAGAGDDYTHSYVDGSFTITEEKTFKIEHQCQTTRATDGFGESSSFDDSVYTVVKITKRA